MGGQPLTGAHVLWATYDAQTGASAMGRDAVTAGVSGTINTPHKGWAKTDFFGGATVSEIDGKAALAITTGRYLGGDVNAASRGALLSWIAERAGVSLGV